MKKTDIIRPLNVKEAMSSVDKSTIEDLQKKESTLKKWFDRVGRPIIREKYVGEFFMKNGLLYQKHQETKTGRISNQLVIPKGLQQHMMSVNHESAFSGHLGAKKTEVRILPNFFGQDYGRASLDSATGVICAKEQTRRVLSRRYH